jgi:hypothetical protein
MTTWTVILLVFGVFVVLGIIFGIIAPKLMRAGKKKRGPSGRGFKKDG